ncbi:Major facilitator superfamily, general substrate transporter domain-containing protein [Rozella allomycis CSF55]|uniref:Major facilitator superfamily, general substrate transporter domain-containing protein n=1 Tax=Rozella allomycis (strain CSF55) TaxID=988480 RepID=A0A075AYA7_ROZAC|nr:Major facilitator superfamily, general substrate transporter domain-containing protein [Rozella allomycis CSF55]|eukprot:EPZ33692.1 Major facilitator superfamily, general substrate transporter domain-containing protein [Rozella allomycis CSF55]
MLFFAIPSEVDEVLKEAAILGVCILISCFSSALYPIANRIVMRQFSKANSDNMYGKQRLFGTIGDVLTIFLMAIVIGNSNYKFLAYFVPITTTLALISILIYVPSDFKEKKGISEISIDKSDLKTENNFMKLLLNRRYSNFLVISLFNGISHAIGMHFFGGFMEDKDLGLGAEKIWISFAHWISCIFEILLLLFSSKLIALVGVKKMTIFAQLCSSIRTGIHAFNVIGSDSLAPKLISLGAESFKGISFGLMTAIGVIVSSHESSASNKTLAQGLFLAVFSGMSQCLGGLVGTFILSYDQYEFIFRGYLGCFRVAFTMSSLALLLSIILNIENKKR